MVRESGEGKEVLERRRDGVLGTTAELGARDELVGDGDEVMIPKPKCEGV